MNELALFEQDQKSFAFKNIIGQQGDPRSSAFNIISVTDAQFGAKGDGVTDDTAAWNAAILASDYVYVPPGTYLLTSLASFRLRNLCLFGAGRASILKFNTTGKGITAGPNIAGDQKYTLTISNLAFTNVTNTPSAFISQEFYVNAVFEKLYFSNCAATYCIENVSGYGTTVRDCVFSDITGGAIRLKDNGAAPNYSYVFGVESCDITRVSGIGIEIETSIIVKISKSVIEGCGGKGISTSTNASGLTSEVFIDTTYFEANTGTDVDLGTNGGSYWGRATFQACFFNTTAVVALGSKSKAVFIGIQGSGGSVLTVSGSSNAEAYLLGCENGNITQSGTFAWTEICNLSTTVPQSYTPTWTADAVNPALGNGILTGTYTRIGKRVDAHIVLTLGTTTTTGTGNWHFTLPFSCSVAGSGLAAMSDAGNADWTGFAYASVGTTFAVGMTSGGTVNNGSNRAQSNVPFVWGSTDILTVDISYWA